MSTKLDQTPKEKLADATRAQRRAQADLEAASDALRRFDEQDPNLDAKLRQERAALESAQAEAEAALRDAKDAFNFCHHQHWAISNHWGRGQEPWRK